MNPEPGGIPAGWVVNTPAGFTPIERLAVGDLVMSAPADGSGKAEPRKVQRTIRREGLTLMKASATYAGGAPGTSLAIAASDATPFWREGHGWTRFDKLPRTAEMRSIEGPCEMWDRDRVYRTPKPGIGFFPATSTPETAWGSLFDYANGEPIQVEGEVYMSPEVWNSGERFLRVTLHDLEVEDHNTYFVSGLWVRATP